MPHCRKQMQSLLADDEIGLIYVAECREYGIRYRDGGSSSQIILFCPWCGSKLPESLGDEWFDRLEQLGLDPGVDKIPEEYCSDRWWKNRSEE